MERSPLALAGRPVGDPQRIGRLGAVRKIRAGTGILRQSAIPEMDDLDELRQPGHSAIVVSVPVCRDEMVESLASGQIFEDVNNSFGVAIVVAWPPGVDQDRLAVGSDQQRG